VAGPAVSPDTRFDGAVGSRCHAADFFKKCLVSERNQD
jgi:hypothetical protein